MASKLEQRRIQIIADGSSVNASIQQMQKASRLLWQEMSKLPPNSEEFVNKSKKFQEINKNLDAAKVAAKGTSEALGGMNKMSGLLTQGLNMAVRAFLPLFAFAEIQKLVTSLFNLEGQWTKLRGTIEQTSDLQGEALDEAAIRSEAIANTFEQTNTEIFANAKVLVNAFGISFNEAFDLVENGLLAAGKNGGEFLEQIKEYSVQFADAGASAEDFAVQTVRALNDGIFSDKGADVVKEFGLRIREQAQATKDAMNSAFGPQFTAEIFTGINDGSITTVEALKRVSKEMNNTEIPANKLQTVVADVFGGPGEDTGLEYLKSLQNVGGSMEDLIDTGSAYVNQQKTRLELEQELARAQELFTEQIEGSNSVIGNLILQGKILFYEVLGKGIQGTKVLMVGLINYFIDLYNNSVIVRAGAQAMSVAYQNAFEVITYIFNNAKDSLLNLGQILKAVFTGDFAAIPALVEKAFLDVAGNAAQMGENIATNVKEGVESVLNGEKLQLIPLDSESTQKEVDQTVKVIEEGQKRVIEAQTKGSEELKKKREEYAKASAELDRQIEDLRISLMEEGIEKEKAKLDSRYQRDLEALDLKKKTILENETLTQEERIAIEEQFAELARQKQIERDEAIKEAQTEQREKDIEEQFAQFDEDQEREILLLENSMINAMDAEFRKKEALLEIQRQYALEKLAILEAAGEGESLQALKLKNTLAQIDKSIADGKIQNEQRVADAKRMIQQTQFEAAKEFLALGIDLMNEDSKARKAFVSAYKAVQIGQIIADGVKEVQAIWKNANSNPINILIPGSGTALAIAQTALATARTAGAVNRIRTTQFATGGSTGSGKVIDMVMGKNGTWHMPNGQSARNVGTFARGGHVNSASLGVIGEAGSEWVGPNWMIRSPKYANIFGYLEAERRRATPFATGGMTASAPPQIPQNSSATADLQQFLRMIEQFGEIQMVLEQIRDLLGEWPSTLRVVNDPRDILDGVRVLNEIESDSRINR